MSERISKLEVVSYDKWGDDDIVKYKLNDKNIISVQYPKTISYRKYIVNGGLIIDKGDKPAYGFRLVRNKYGQYLYKRMSDGTVMPFIFDFATNFNKYGLAMVAKDGKVSWINKKFEFFSDDCKVQELTEEYFMRGWNFIGAFSGGDEKLSRCQGGDGEYGYIETSFLGTDMQVKKFYRYLNEHINGNGFEGVYTDFNEEGYSFRKDKKVILSSVGYYMDTEEFLKKAIEENQDLFVKTAIENGILDSFNEKIKEEKSLQKK